MKEPDKQAFFVYWIKEKFIFCLLFWIIVHWTGFVIYHLINENKDAYRAFYCFKNKLFTMGGILWNKENCS